MPLGQVTGNESASRLHALGSMGIDLGGDVTRASRCDVVRCKVGVLSLLRAFRGVSPVGLKCHAASSLRNVSSAAARCACAVALSSAIQF